MYVSNIVGKSWVNEEGWLCFLREIIWKTDETNLIQFDEAPMDEETNQGFR